MVRAETVAPTSWISASMLWAAFDGFEMSMSAALASPAMILSAGRLPPGKPYVLSQLEHGHEI